MVSVWAPGPELQVFYVRILNAMSTPLVTQLSAAPKIVDAIRQDVLVQERPDPSEILVSNGLARVAELIDDLLHTNRIPDGGCTSGSGNRFYS